MEGVDDIYSVVKVPALADVVHRSRHITPSWFCQYAAHNGYSMHKHAICPTAPKPPPTCAWQQPRQGQGLPLRRASDGHNKSAPLPCGAVHRVPPKRPLTNGVHIPSRRQVHRPQRRHKAAPEAPHQIMQCLLPSAAQRCCHHLLPVPLVARHLHCCTAVADGGQCGRCGFIPYS